MRAGAKRRTNRPEQSFQLALVGLLRAALTPKTYFFACPNGGYRSHIEAAIMVGQGVRRGVPDLILVHDGRIFGLEIKSEKGRLTDDQRATHIDMERAGARIATVRSIEEAIAQLVAWSIPHRIPFEAPVGAHSEKPDEVHEMIEAYFPHLPKIELNARRARAGWVTWGYEAPEGPSAEMLPPHDPETGEIYEESNATPAGAVMAARSGATGGESAAPFADALRWDGRCFVRPAEGAPPPASSFKDTFDLADNMPAFLRRQREVVP